MAGMNGQIHLNLETADLNKLRKEAEDMEISVAELIRRKLADPVKPEEIIKLREVIEVLGKQYSKQEMDKLVSQLTNQLNSNKRGSK
jgi:uncharacterized protein (DUF2267 family)